MNVSQEGREGWSEGRGEEGKGWFTRTTQAHAQARAPFSCACACVVPVHTWLMLVLVLVLASSRFTRGLCLRLCLCLCLPRTCKPALREGIRCVLGRYPFLARLRLFIFSNGINSLTRLPLTPRRYVFDVTSVDQCSSPWPCKLAQLGQLGQIIAFPRCLHPFTKPQPVCFVSDNIEVALLRTLTKTDLLAFYKVRGLLAQLWISSVRTALGSATIL